MVVECHKCNLTVEGVQEGSYLVLHPDDPGEKQKYTFLKCPKCLSPILTLENLEYYAGEFDYGLPIQLFPLEGFHINPSIPEQLRIALFESIQCFKSGATTATVIMCRRTIEGFCTLKNVEGRNLAVSLEKLKDSGIINDQLFEWANELRISGNEAAHNFESTFSPTDSRDILDFTIAILDFSYSFKDKFDSYKERRKKITNIK